ncbi:putative allene oxide cyclase/dirigent protein [Lupinus albus]|uniref:Putative allene oxide cyclase/dirigent protein n=1 Tax=Lupinus albus TaxID=3870 RepID=A0A6A4NZA7_LUPAL|nr:putative allene oxide cyclase/dirigent protein [Lupinus albus]
MAKKLTFTPFPLKAIVFHLFLLSIGISYVKTDKVLTFLMHNNLGGLTPSERIVAGIIANSQTINLPFSKPNNRVFPIKGSVPLFDTSIDVTNPGSLTNTVVITNINKNKVVIDHSNTLPYVIQNQLPLGATLGNVLFGRITVIDDEITQGRISFG